jgi:GxxExxY protein
MVRLIYPELSYKIIGIIFEVYNELGGGYQEKYYQRAVSLGLKRKMIKYKEQVSVALRFAGERIGRYFIDFIVDDKIVLELKVGNCFYPRDVKQVLAYLKAYKLKLGILVLFTRSGIRYKRIINNELTKY